MRKFLKTLTGVASAWVLSGLVVPDEAFAVAGFARQTGMSCNHCHTLHGAPTPNFTFTGKKFNAAGYRLLGGLHNVTDRSQEQGVPEDLGEFLRLLPTTFSGRFQYQVASSSEPPGTDDWGPVITNPTSRLAFFPFTGPVGEHFGLWTEIYLVPLTSDDDEWSVLDGTYDEFDFRYIFDPSNHETIRGVALTNQGIDDLFGFGPFPGLPSEIGRGGVGGYAHPNRAGIHVYGWEDNRWVWAVGPHSALRELLRI